VKALDVVVAEHRRLNDALERRASAVVRYARPMLTDPVLELDELTKEARAMLAPYVGPDGLARNANHGPILYRLIPLLERTESAVRELAGLSRAIGSKSERGELAELDSAVARFGELLTLTQGIQAAFGEMLPRLLAVFEKMNARAADAGTKVEP
jgi:hypothetical protein